MCQGHKVNICSHQTSEPSLFAESPPCLLANSKWDVIFLASLTSWWMQAVVVHFSCNTFSHLSSGCLNILPSCCWHLVAYNSTDYFPLTAHPKVVSFSYTIVYSLKILLHHTFYNIFHFKQWICKSSNFSEIKYFDSEMIESTSEYIQSTPTHCNITTWN